MYYSDTHTHTILSMDGHVPLSALADAALSAGLSALTVTDHYDFFTEDGKKAPALDWGPALAQFHETAPRYAGKLDLHLGIEMGAGAFFREEALSFLSLPELDFVIGSVHNMSPEKGGIDLFYLNFEKLEDCYATLDDYFTCMAHLAARPDLYDVMGHIIYPLRYMPDGVSLLGYKDVIDVILKAVVEAGRGIEINTCRGKTIGAWWPILRRYRALGGEIVTTGSDAHTVEGVGKGIAQACDLLRETGFRYVAVYDKRKPVFHKL